MGFQSMFSRSRNNVERVLGNREMISRIDTGSFFRHFKEHFPGKHRGSDNNSDLRLAYITRLTHKYNFVDCKQSCKSEPVKDYRDPRNDVAQSIVA